MYQSKTGIGEELLSDRRARILDAAERSFCRAGFHRTTMHDVATEAGMSPGNLYRYFPSKDALVAGLCERDRVNLGREFKALGETADFLAAFRALGDAHVKDDRTPRAKLCLEIWAEATRNPAIAALQADFDNNFMEQLASVFEKAKAGGLVHSSVDARAVASIVSKLGNGLFVRRATAADFDPDREIGEVFAVIAGLLQGAIALPGSAPTQETER